MVVIYDRFVFFSVEKFFIPLLYSCLNILVQRSCASVCVCMCVRACVLGCTFLRVCVCACACVCTRVAYERGGAPRERSATEKDRTRGMICREGGERGRGER